MVAQKKSSALSNYLEDKQQLTDELEVEHEKLSADSSCQATKYTHWFKNQGFGIVYTFWINLLWAKRDGE